MSPKALTPATRRGQEISMSQPTGTFTPALQARGGGGEEESGMHCTFLRLLRLLSRQKSCCLSRVSSSNLGLIRKLSEASPRQSKEETDLAQGRL